MSAALAMGLAGLALSAASQAWPASATCDAHLHTGMDAAAYDQAQFDEASAGYRLAREAVSDDAGHPRFAALWVHDGLPQRQSRGAHGVDAFYAVSLQMVGQGYKLADLTVGVVGGSPWFGALWTQPRERQQAIEYWVGAGELRLTLARPGRAVLAIAPYRIGKIAYFAAAYDVAPGLKPAARIGLSRRTLERLDRKMGGRGYVLTRRIAEPGRRPRFTALWGSGDTASPCTATILAWPNDSSKSMTGSMRRRLSSLGRHADGDGRHLAVQAIVFAVMLRKARTALGALE